MTAAAPEFELVNRGTVTLGATTYRVEEQRYTDRAESTVWLHGPRGAVYFLRGFLLRAGQTDDGQRQVISWKSGSPLRVRGHEMRVTVLGDVIEVHTPAPRGVAS